MKDPTGTHQKLLKEISALQQKIRELERPEDGHLRAGSVPWEGEVLLKSYLENAPDGIFVSDINGIFLYCNRRCEEITCYPRDELIGKNFLHMKILSEKSQPKAAMLLRTNAEGRSTGPDEIEVVNRQGHTVPVEVKTTVVDHMGQRVVLCVVRDVTERKLAEKALKLSEATYREIFNKAGVTIWVHDVETFEIIDVSQSVTETHGYSVEEAKRLSLDDIISGIPPYTREATEDLLRRASAGEPQRMEWQCRHKDGHMFWAEVSIKKATIVGRESILVVGRDITDRKKTEESLRASEERFNLAVEGTGAGLWDWDMVEDRVVFSERWKSMLGYSQDEVEDSFFGWKNLWHPEDAPRIEKAVRDHLEGRTERYEIEHRLRHKDGSWHWILTRGDIVRDSRGEPRRWVGTNLDVTDRKLVEQALQESEQRYRSLFENSVVGIFQTTPNGRFLSANHLLAKLFGYASPEEIIGAFSDIGSQHYANSGDREIFRRILETEGIIKDFETKLLKKDGTPVWASLTARAVRDGERGPVLYYEGILEDITARKHAEEALRESETRNRTFLEAMPDIVFIYSREGIYLDYYASDRGSLAVEPERFLSRSVNEVLPADLAEEFLNCFERAHETKRTQVLGYPLDTLGGPRFFEARITAMDDRRQLAIIRDITEQKQAEEALRRSEEYNRSIVQVVPDLMIRTNRDGEYLDIIGHDEGKLAQPKNRLLGGKVGEFLPRKEASLFLDHVGKSLDTGQLQSIEYELQVLEGRLWFEARIVPLGEEEALCLIRDVTGRKQAEETLRENEEKFRILYESINEMTLLHEVVYDETGSVARDYRVLDCNPAFTRVTGIPREEAVGRLASDLYGTGKPPYLDIFAHVADTGEPSRFETYFAPMGKYFNISVSSPKKGHFVSITTDITEQKKAEESLRQSERRLASIIDFLPDATFALDREGRIIAWNRAIEEMTGYPAGEMLGRGDYEYAIPFYGERRPILVDLLTSWDDEVGRTYSYIEKEGDTLYTETEVPSLQGMRRILWAKAVPLRDEKGNVTGAIETIRDTTGQKRTEEELQESNERLLTVLNSIEAFVYIADMQTYEVLFINEYGRRQWGRDVTGETCWKAIQRGQAGPCPFCTNDRLLTADGQSSGIFQWQFRNTIDGRWYNCSDRAIKWTDGRMVRMEMAADITDRKLAEDALRESEQKYRSIFENSVVGIFQTTPEGGFLSVNPYLAKLYGYASPQDMMEQVTDIGIQHYANPEDREIFKRTLESEGSITDFETKVLKRDGTSVWIALSARLVKDDTGSVVRYEGTLVDITPRKRAEEELKLYMEKLRRSEELLRQAQSIAKVGGWEYDPSTKKITWTDEVYRIYGVTREYDPNDIDQDIGFYAPGDRETIERAFERAVSRGEPYDIELKFVSAAGTSKWVRTIGQPVMEDGKIIKVVGNIVDITDRKKAEETLKQTLDRVRQAEETISAAINSADESLVLIDREGTVLLSNTVGAKRLGKSVDELTGTCLYDHFSPEVARSRKEHFDRVFETGEAVHFEDARAGRHFELHAYPVPDENGRIPCITIFARDITSRKQMEQSLMESEKKYRSIFENVAEGIFQADIQGKLITVNPAMAKMHGYASPKQMLEEVTDIGRQLFTREEDGENYIRRLREERGIRQFEAKVNRRDGEVIWASINARIVRDQSGNIVRYEGTTEDITKGKKAEENLKDSAEKLRKNLVATIEVISMMLEARDPYTAGHQRRVSKLSRSIAQEMGLPKDIVDAIRMAGNIHDIGKMSVPAEILVKPARLSDIEMKLMKVHPQTGYDILNVVDLPFPVADTVLQHHERLDGSGYPQGLKDGEILLEAQILSVADVIEAMASHRPYRPGLGIDAALEEIERKKGILYHPDVVNACLRLFREKGFKFE